MNIDQIIIQAQELGRKNWLHAMHVLQSAVDEHPNEPRLHTSMAELFIFRMQYSMALKHYLRALSIEPDNLQIIQAIGACYMATGEYRLALVYYKRIPNPSEDILYNIGYAQALMGKSRDCINTMLKLSKRLPNHPYVYFVIIEQYMELGDTDEALHYIQIAQKYAGEHIQLYLFAGLIYSQKDMWMLSYYNYRKAAEAGKINNPEHMMSFAAAALKTGLPRESIRILRESERKWPYLSEIYANLAKTYIYLGEIAEAEKVLARAKKNLAHLSPALRLMQERLKET
ncbi:MAG: hypothetical protein WCQ59_03830 [Candidatus Cloacimonadaceae bacterium]|jgi:tetratricopeptide (TPR) repeat protein|nr:hypothetical protein [Candidatus Cloacimonadota bacterium]MDD4560411.1 hypothetical protein [Candidatus Cloacimonadota bacterium]